jgi:hypothetical protein
MKQYIIIILLLVGIISTATCAEQRIAKSNFDLGDGYKATFKLPDISYVLDYAYTEQIAENPLCKAYGFTVSSSEGKLLATVTMYAYLETQPQYLPKAGIEDSALSGTMGPRIITHKIISGAPGYIGYDLPVDATGTDTSNAMTGFFKCFPGASEGSNGLESLFEISGETSEFPASDESLQVLNELADSITISGRGI